MYIVFISVEENSRDIVKKSCQAVGSLSDTGKYISRVERKTGVSQMVVFPQT